MEYKYIEFKPAQIQTNYEQALKKAVTVHDLAGQLDAENNKLYQELLKQHNVILKQAASVYPKRVLDYLKKNAPEAPVRNRNQKLADKFCALVEQETRRLKANASSRASYLRRKARTEMMYQDLRAWLIEAGYQPDKDFTDNPPNVFWFIEQRAKEWFGNVPRWNEVA